MPEMSSSMVLRALVTGNKDTNSPRLPHTINALTHTSLLQKNIGDGLLAVCVEVIALL
jgi:hypothetical protein